MHFRQPGLRHRVDKNSWDGRTTQHAAHHDDNDDGDEEEEEE